MTSSSEVFIHRKRAHILGIRTSRTLIRKAFMDIFSKNIFPNVVS